MAGENLDFKVRVLGIKEIVDLQNQIQGVSKQVSDYSKKIKKNEGDQVENTKAMLTAKSELQRLRKEYREGTKEQKKVQESTKKTTSFTMKMATAFGVAQLAVDGFQKAMKLIGQQIKESIVVFKEFDFQMQKVKAISGANELEFKRLKESAEELGRTTFFTATQVAELQTNLSKLGFTAEEILKAQDATLATATATGENLARTATVMGSAIRGFGLDASEATRVADVMAVAFTNSALDIEKFQTSMTKVAPIAKMAGFEIEGTTAIMASLTDAGIEASIAGTSLRNILLRLADPTSKLSKRLGGAVSSVDELIPRLKEMKDSGIVLSDVLGITDRRTAAAFGRMLDSAESVKILTEQLRNSEGAALDMANIVGDSLQGAMLRFKSATDGLRIALVDLFGDRLQKAFDAFARFFNSLASEKSIKNLQRLGSAIKVTVLAIAAYRLGAIAATTATTLFVASKKASASAFSVATLAANTYHAAKLRVIAATRTFTAALAQTGIGVIVIALGALVAKMISYNNEMGEAIDLNSQLREGEKDLALQIKQTETNLGRLRETRELMNKMSKEGNINQERYNKLVKAEKKLIADLNKELKNNNKDLISQKDNIDDITLSITGKGGLIEAMKNLMLVEAFQNMNKELLRVATASDIIKVQLGEAFENVTPEQIAKVNKELKEMGGFRGTLTELSVDFADLVFSLFNPDHKGSFADVELLDTLLETYGITLQQFLDSLEEGYFEDMEAKIQQIILERGAATGLDVGDLFGGTGTDSEENEGLSGIAERRAKEVERHNELLLQIRHKFRNDDDRLKLNELLAEKRHLKEMKKLLEEEREDTSKIDLKRQQNQLAIADQRRLIEMKSLQQSFDDEKFLLDEQLANRLITEQQHKQQMLKLEADFLMKKKDLYYFDLEELKSINAQIRSNDLETIAANREALQQRIADVNNLGGAMIELGGIMGENNKLVQIGTKLQQAAAVATSVATLAEKLNIKTKEGGIIATIKSALAKGGETVANAGAAVPFPLNIAAIAAVVALLSKSMKLFGIGGGGDVEGDTNPEGTFDQYEQGGLTRGGMFKGNSHANGGVKFAVGGRIMEAEGGEAIINKKSTAKFKPILSAINSYNGNGVKFADGGLINSGEKFARGGELRELTSLISQQSSRQRVVMVESDVTDTQNRVSNVESQATF
jgi:TP901 family phage tail tape measure protein